MFVNYINRLLVVALKYGIKTKTHNHFCDGGVYKQQGSKLWMPCYSFIFMVMVMIFWKVLSFPRSENI